jgi:hypothetical protein
VVTTFKWFNISPGRVVSWAHRIEWIFLLYNSGHVIRNRTYNKCIRYEIIFWGHHIQVKWLSPEEELYHELTTFNLSGYFPYNSGHFIKKLIDLIAKARYEIIFWGHHI